MYPVHTGKFQPGTDKVLNVGDYISVKTKSGKEFEFTVKEITAEKLYGENAEVNISEIIEIKRKELSFAKSSGLTAVIWVGVSLILLSCCFIVS